MPFSLPSRIGAPLIGAPLPGAPPLRGVFLLAALAVAMSTPAMSAPADEDGLPRPAHLVTAGDPADPAIQAGILAGRRYAAFWDSGDAAYARAALAPDFTDRTLPPGRPQGLPGPLQASAGFRAAVPDLRVAIDEMVVAGDRVVVRLALSGHFTGRFDGRAGKGEAVSFRAVDVYAVKDGRITDNWHLEDNLTLLRQLGAVAP